MLTDSTFYINLARREDRRAHCLAQLASVGIHHPVRIEAVDMPELPALGCTISHIHALQKAIEMNLDTVFICEDDIMFTQPEVFKQNILALSQFPPDCAWNVTLVAANVRHINGCMGSVRGMHPGSQLVCVDNAFSCAGYIVRNGYMRTLLANFQESGRNLQLHPTQTHLYAADVGWKTLQKDNSWWMVWPPTVSQVPSFSDIEKKEVDYSEVMIPPPFTQQHLPQ